MKSYLSRIAARAGGIPEGVPVNESNKIKPIIHQWSAGETFDNSNPFEEINKPINPVQNTAPLRIDKKPGDMILNKQTQLKHTPPDHDVTPPVPTAPVISYTVKQPEGPHEQESIVPTPPSPPKANEALNLDKPVKEKKQEKIVDPFKKEAADIITPEITGPIEPEMTDTIKPETADTIKPETADTMKPGKADTVKPGDTKKTVSPVSVTNRFIHKQVSIQSMEESMEDKRPVQEQVIRETTKPGKETVLQQAANSTAGTIDKKVTNSLNAPVSELRPVSPNNPVKFIPLKKENKEPQLKIDRLKVEVVTPQPVKTQPTVIRKVTRVKESKPASAGYSVFSKMRYGLGQI